MKGLLFEVKKDLRKASPMHEAMRRVLEGYDGEIRWDAPLASYTSLKVGGPADALVFPRTISALSSLMKKISERQLPCFVLGRGSNLLVRDGGIEGIVLHLKHLDHITVLPDFRILAESGASYPRLSLLAAEKSWSGLEFAIGIPGTIGGAVAMNAGIPGAETASILEQVTLVDGEGKVHRRPTEFLDFGYRKSGLQGGIVAAATFALKSAPRAEIEARMKALLKRRQATQPLDHSNCGSVFKNPPGNFAGSLIERCGLRGFACGEAAISEVHANFVVNRGRARAKDFLRLIEKMQRAVQARFGIALALEVKVVGRP